MKKSFPPPLYWQDFELLVATAMEKVKAFSRVSRIGRPGTEQQGVDIYGWLPTVGHVGVECKLINRTTTRFSLSAFRSLLHECIIKAGSFRPALDRLVVATSLPRNASFQAAVRELNDAPPFAQGLEVWFWDDFQIWLNLSQALRAEYDASAGPDPVVRFHPNFPLRPEPVIGRGGYFKKLDRVFGDATGAAAVISLFGPSGIGKTSIGLEYAYRNAEHYENVIFLQADTKQRLLHDYAALLTYFKLPTTGLSLDSQLALVREELERPLRRLLVIDDLLAPEQLDRLAPRIGGCDVIVTSKRVDCPSATRVSPLAPGDAWRLLSPAMAEGVPEQALRRLAQEVGGCPGLLIQAREHVRLGGPSSALALTKSIASASRRGEAAKLGFERAVGLASTMTAGAVPLLAALCYLSRDAVPTWLIDRIELPELTDEISRLRAIEALTRVCLVRTVPEQIRAEDESYFEGVRHFTDDSTTIMAALHDALDDAMKGDWGETGWLQRMGALFVHSDQLTDRSLVRGPFAKTWLLADRTASYFQVRGMSDDANRNYVKALRSARLTDGARSEAFAFVLSDFSLLMRDQGNHAASARMLRKALRLREEILPPTHAYLAVTLNNLGLAYLESGDAARAEPLFRRALHIDEVALGRHDPSTIFDIFNLAQSLRLQHERLDEAGALYREALLATFRKFGARSNASARRLVGWAKYAEAMGRTAAAWRILRRIDRYHRTTMGDAHPERLRTLRDLVEFEMRHEALIGPATMLEALVDAYRVAKRAPDELYERCRRRLANMSSTTTAQVRGRCE